MKTIKQFLIDYSRDVISGEIVACEKHTWACERFLNNMDIHVTAEDQAHWDDTVRQFKAHNITKIDIYLRLSGRYGTEVLVTQISL